MTTSVSRLVTARSCSSREPKRDFAGLSDVVQSREKHALHSTAYRQMFIGGRGTVEELTLSDWKQGQNIHCPRNNNKLKKIERKKIRTISYFPFEPGSGLLDSLWKM